MEKRKKPSASWISLEQAVKVWRKSGLESDESFPDIDGLSYLSRPKYGPKTTVEIERSTKLFFNFRVLLQDVSLYRPGRISL